MNIYTIILLIASISIGFYGGYLVHKRPQPTPAKTPKLVPVSTAVVLQTGRTVLLRACKIQHVDGRLDLYDPADEIVATFAPGSWLYVEVDPKQVPSTESK